MDPNEELIDQGTGGADWLAGSFTERFLSGETGILPGGGVPHVKVVLRKHW